MMKAKWIWENTADRADEYVRFYKKFSLSKVQKIQMDISCDSNYELYVNGQLAGFGAYADFPYSKTFDRLDITPFCHEGENCVSILVWYFGADFFTYYKNLPGLLFEISEDGNIVAASDETTLCRKAVDYRQGQQKLITRQLGYSYSYDAGAYDGCNEQDFVPATYHPAVEVFDRPEEQHLRPIKKLILTDRVKASLIDDRKCIYDLGQETVGYLYLNFRAKAGTEIVISWGEHLVPDGMGGNEVPRIIGVGKRDFSVTLTASGEWFSFSNFMRRLGCRYLCVTSAEPVEIKEIGLLAAEYPVTILPFDTKNELRQRIYDISVRTLQMCMFEHYEDCPWREQSLYTMDSRNQMLCGYLAFGETAFARASLELFAQDRREDGLLNICAPTRLNRPIPFFSLVYPIQMWEYACYSGDWAFMRKYYSKLKELLQAFYNRFSGNVVKSFPETGKSGYWNFYEWNEDLNGLGAFEYGEEHIDLCLNAILSLASQKMSFIAEKIGNADDFAYYTEQAERINCGIRQKLYCETERCYLTRVGCTGISALGNALAILCGAATKSQAREICERITKYDGKEKMVPATLSMKAWVYDALLMTDDERYGAFILDDIDRVYKKMLDAGATSFWETEDGAAAFGGAGSLCHGWSAIPILYYHRLLPHGLLAKT